MVSNCFHLEVEPMHFAHWSNIGRTMFALCLMKSGKAWDWDKVNVVPTWIWWKLGQCGRKVTFDQQISTGSQIVNNPCLHDVLHDSQATCSFPIFGYFWQLVFLPAANRHLPFFQVFFRSQEAQSRETDLNLGHALCGEHSHHNQWLWARLSFSSKKVFPCLPIYLH